MDFQKHAITALGNASVTVPRFSIEALICDSSTGATLFDLTGPNAVIFPNDLGPLTAARKLAFARYIAQWMVLEAIGQNT
jgi:hypothetical protein